MKGSIPEVVRTRVDKMGFPTPIRKWFAEPLNQAAFDIIKSKSFVEKGIFNTEVIAKDIERHRKGLLDISEKLFTVLQFELWSKNLEVNNTF